MAVLMPDVVVISSDDDSDGEGNFVTEVMKPDLVLISSDDDDGDVERNLDEGLVSEEEADYDELDDHESDKEEANDAEKLNEEECIGNCNVDGSGPSNQGGNDLHAPSLFECKTYLRKHGMRVYETKEECIQRIEEHERLKDGRGESLYPISSFSINCTGDVCRGDVVLFKQSLYNSQRKIIGRRIVAGRIANESYDASTQHTFSVEVLWSKPFKQLDPLYILLVKGCNLYRFGTFRQPWGNEAERLKVLEEKHERGKAARRKRKLRETEFASSDNKGTKRRKVFHRVPSQSKNVTGLHKETHVNKDATAHNQAVLFQNEELKTSTELTYHQDPNCSHIQEASLPFSNDRTLLPNNLLPVGFLGCSHHNNEQGPSQTTQSPDHHDHNSELPVDRSKDEKAKLHFPISSFSINCTGDARERDIVLFKQQVYFGKKNMEKKRTVAGRIVNVRQCEARDKHRFVIKVLWTMPSINNRRRSPLVVRSHNLYKFGTFRQPWKNEALRSQMFEEKHGSATRKRKLKKTDIALNKKKGVKRQKVSHNGPSTSKQPTQVAKHKSFKRKGIKETKTGHKKKLQMIKMKKSKPTFHLDPNPDPSLSISPNLITSPTLNPISSNTNPIMSTTSHPISSITSSPISNTTSNPNPILNTTSNPISSTASNPNPISDTASNPNPISNTTSNPNPSLHLNRNAHQNGKPKTRQNGKPKTRQNGKPNERQSRNPNLSQNQNLNAHQNKNPNARQNQYPNTRRSQNPSTSHNPYPNPNPNSLVYGAQQVQESALSLPLIPNPPSAVWFPPNQPAGYGGQWGPNHVFIQPPGYNYLAVQLLMSLLFQQPL